MFFTTAIIVIFLAHARTGTYGTLFSAILVGPRVHGIYMLGRINIYLSQSFACFVTVAKVSRRQLFSIWVFHSEAAQEQFKNQHLFPTVVLFIIADV